MNRQTLDDMFQVDDADLDRLAKEYESGTWEGELGAPIQGRPPIFDQAMEMISVRISRTQIKDIDQMAAIVGQSRSEFLRTLIDTAVRKAG